MGHKIYLSGPLFSQAEIDWGKHISTLLQKRLNGIDILWPHEMAAESPEDIFKANLQALDECDLMVAILDGPQVDDGSAWEIGYFFSQGKSVLGIRTDFRRAGEHEHSQVNLMIECSCLALVDEEDRLVEELKRLMA
jgi:nucleoside 2-deoxyribosyltransferase